jgi:glycosyltransferase involved in cell wall biosynthesis
VSRLHHGKYGEISQMKQKAPLFSVVIPTYNRAKIIGRAIESVLNQTFQGFEIVIVDNGSDDDTQSVVEGYGDDRIRYFWQEGSGSPASPRNTGISKAKGDWVCFLDTDDAWYHDKLRMCFEHIENSVGGSVDLLHHDLRIVGNKGFFTRKTVRSRQLETPIAENLLVNMNVIATSSVVVRKTLLDQVGGFNESPEMAASEDLNLWLKISEITNYFFYIPEILGEYLLDDGGLSRKDMSACYKTATADFLKYLNSKQRKKHSARFSYMHGRSQYTQGDFSIMKENLVIALKYGDTELRVKSAWMLLASFLKKQ